MKRWVINYHQRDDVAKSSLSLECMSGSENSIAQVHDRFVKKNPDAVVTAITFRGDVEEL